MRGSIAGSAREEEPNYFCSTGVGVLGVEVERAQNALAGGLDVDNLDGGELLAPLVVPGATTALCASRLLVKYSKPALVPPSWVR